MSTATARPPATGPRRSTLVLTLVLHLLALWPYAVSGLVAPAWGVAALLVLWVLLGVGAVAVHRRWGAVAAVVPLVAVLAWVGLITLGGTLLGWTG